MIRWLVLVMAISGTAAAENARVISGEHADFTRLVVELPATADWAVGRTAMGYGFKIRAEVQPTYDLSRVWDRIPRSRLQALRVDPESGALVLALACDCHFFPFEYRPGTVVLDIRQGSAPPGSVFEEPLTRVSGLLPGNKPPFAPEATRFSWLDLPRLRPEQRPFSLLPAAPGGEGATLDPLRDELLLQLSRGAADGVVEMVLPGKPAIPEVQGMGDLSGALIRIGELPGLEVGTALDAEQHTDEACIPDKVIDLSGWGSGRPALDLLVEARTGLYQEFDAPSPQDLARSVRLHLYLGFGAEARQYAALIDGAESDPAMSTLLSMARLIDGEPDPSSPFVAMTGCDGAAALWAVLTHASIPTAASLNADAVVRSFRALPPHLRRHLGPRLAELLLQRDAEAARMIRDAFRRTQDVAAGPVALMDAMAELHASRPDAAVGHAEAVVEADGADLAGLAALVEAHLQSGTALSPEVAASLVALRELDGAHPSRRERAVILALALSGQTEDAFAIAGPDHPDLADLWKAAARHADEDAFLAHAVLSPAMSPPEVEAEVGLAIAKRLAAGGFHETALQWLGQVEADADPARRVVAARSQLALGNARRTLQLIAGLSNPEVQELRADAFRQLGAYSAAREALVSAGNAEEGTRLASWGGDWSQVQVEGSPVWAEASLRVQPAPTDATAPLAAGQAALSDSAAARAAIEALLAAVQPP
jgi:hypothetical protein